jgi:hypothetical protein
MAKVRKVAQRYALSGLATCGYCGSHLNFQRDPSGKGRVACYRRRQTTATECRQRSYFIDGIEAQISAYLATFQLDEDTVGSVVAMYEQAQNDRDDGERRRQEIGNRLERITELYKWGDLTREAYTDERDRLQAELATLQGAVDASGLLTQAAAFLRDLPSMWKEATAEQRNAMAALVFESVEIKDDRVVAVVVNPQFAPFFVQWESYNSGTDGADCQDSCGSLVDGAPKPVASAKMKTSPDVVVGAFVYVGRGAWRPGQEALKIMKPKFETYAIKGGSTSSSA